MKKLLLVAILSSTALAAQADEGSYMGVGLGYATQKITSDNLVSGANQHTGKFGAKVYGGYQFNDNFALEAGYNYLNRDKIDWSSTSSSGHVKIQGHIFSLAATGILPLNETFSLFGKLGAAGYYTKTESEETKKVLLIPVSHSQQESNQTKFAPVFGVGAEYKLNKASALRVEYENFGKPKVTAANRQMQRVDMVSIGVRTAF